MVEIKRYDAGLDETQDATYYLQLYTRTASFRLTLDDMKMESLAKDHSEDPIRFGITDVRRSDLGAEEEWLGTILLPASYQRKLLDEHEFVFLSSAYCFVSDELSLDISSTLEPYAAINVMLITRESTAVYDGRPVVVRAGVGRMLKKAWDTAEVRWEDIIVA